MGGRKMEFLKEYWDEIVALVDKIYEYIKNWILNNAE